MPVVVQPAFRVEILALKMQRVVDYSHIETGDFAVDLWERPTGSGCNVQIFVGYRSALVVLI